MQKYVQLQENLKGSEDEVQRKIQELASLNSAMDKMQAKLVSTIENLYYYLIENLIAYLIGN